MSDGLDCPVCDEDLADSFGTIVIIEHAAPSLGGHLVGRPVTVCSHRCLVDYATRRLTELRRVVR